MKQSINNSDKATKPFTQAQVIMNELIKGREMSYREMVIELGINHPKEVIYNLRKKGYPIERERIESSNGRHYFRFFLAYRLSS